MKKQILIIAFLVSCVTSMMAEGIKFVEGKTFDEALNEAKKENKMLFVDCYTSWCGPCKMMATKVFTQDKVGEYFNARFVSIKIDMEKGEGPAMKDKFGVKAFPTFLFLDGTGKEVNRIVGGDPDIDAFLKTVSSGLGEMSLSAMTVKYDGGERDTTFLARYLEVLDRAYDSKKSAEVAGELIKGREADMLTNATLFQTFLKYASDPYTAQFQYVLKNKAAFTAKYGDRQVDMGLSRVWRSYPYSFVKKQADGTYSYDTAARKAYADEMKRWQVKIADEVLLNSDINAAEKQGRWKDYAKLCSKSIKDYGENDMLIYNWVLRIKKGCRDAKVRKTAVGWMETRMKNIAKEKAAEKPLPNGAIRAMPMMDFGKYYAQLISELGSVGK